MTGTLFDETLLDGELKVMIGGRDVTLDSAEVVSEVGGKRAQPQNPPDASNMLPDSDVDGVRGECVTSASLRRARVARDSGLLATSLFNYLNASWTLSEFSGGGLMPEKIGTRSLVMTDNHSLFQLGARAEAFLMDVQFVPSGFLLETALWDGRSGEILVTRCNLQTQVASDLAAAKMDDSIWCKERRPRATPWHVAVIAEAKQSMHPCEADGTRTCSDLHGIRAA